MQLLFHFVSLFLLSWSLCRPSDSSIHGGLVMVMAWQVNQWIWLRATSCVPADCEPESWGLFSPTPLRLTVFG
jgi:hypothetical protein